MDETWYKIQIVLPMPGEKPKVWLEETIPGSGSMKQMNRFHKLIPGSTYPFQFATHFAIAYKHPGAPILCDFGHIGMQVALLFVTYIGKGELKDG